MKWIRFKRRLSLRKRDVRWGLVPSTMFRERHRLMLRHGKMKSLRCLESPSSCVESPSSCVESPLSCVMRWTRRDLLSQLVWVDSRASWTL
ncbi:unnamed protein product [Brassica oleracea]